MKPKKIILVFKTHFDIGFTDLSSNVIANYASGMLKEVIETCRKTQDMGPLRYVWTMPAWPLMHIVNHAAPELKKELDALIENGQVAWHALPFTTHTDFCSQKEYLEGLKYSRMLAELYHKPCPSSAKMTDVPGHSIMLPDLLSQAGIRFLHLGCNEFATPPEVPDLFFWEGAGKRQVLTMYSKGGYGTGLVPPKGWKYPVWMALMHTFDNKGPQSAETIRRLAEEIREIYPEAEVVCGTMDDFYRELIKCDLSDVPVIQKDLADTWIHGVGAYPAEVAQVRRTRRQMEGLQALWLGKWLDNAAECSAESEWMCRAKQLQEQYYEEIALFEEHTWGADVKTWLGPERVYEKRAFLEEKKSASGRFMEQSWEEQRQRAVQAEDCQQKLEALLEVGGAGAENWYLFYGGGESYTGWVKLPEGWGRSGALVDGKPALCADIEGDRYCYVENLPGFTSVLLQKAPEADACAEQSSTANLPAHEAMQTGSGSQTANTGEEGSGSPAFSAGESSRRSLENHRYRLEFCGETGALLSLWDKKLGCCLLQGGRENSIFSYQYDKYGYDDINEYLRSYGYHFTTWGIQDYGRENYPFCDHETFTPAFSHYELDKNRVRFFFGSRDESAEKYGNAVSSELEITLPPAGEEIFIGLHLKEKQESPFVESGSFRILTGEQGMDFRMQKGGALLDPKKDIADRANHSLYCLENGMAAFGKEAGLCIKTLDAPLAALGNPGIYRYAPRFEQQGDGIYINLFNNMWGTNFPQWTGGDLHFSFAVSGMKREEEGALAQKLNGAEEQVRVTKNRFGTLGFVLPEQMRLIGADAAEEGMLIQLSDLSGTSFVRTLTVKGCRITPVDLNGRPLGETAEEVCRFKAAAWGIEAFLLEKKTHEKQQQ